MILYDKSPVKGFCCISQNMLCCITCSLEVIILITSALRINNPLFFFD